MGTVPVVAEKLQVYAGDSWSQPFAFKVPVDPDADPIVLGPEDLSAFTDWQCQWRTSDAATEPITLTVDSTDKATGDIIVSATPEQTRSMGRDGVADVQAVNGSETRTFIRFRTDWQRDVTR